MNYKTSLVVLFFWGYQQVVAQSVERLRPMEYRDVDKWGHFETSKISNDGKAAAFEYATNYSAKKKVILYAVSFDVNREFTDISDWWFSDNAQYFYGYRNDTIFQVNLVSGKIAMFPGIHDLIVLALQERTIITWRSDANKEALYINHTDGWKPVSVDNVSNNSFSNDGNYLFVSRKSGDGFSAEIIALPTLRKVYATACINCNLDVQFSPAADRVAFLASGTDGSQRVTVTILGKRNITKEVLTPRSLDTLGQRTMITAFTFTKNGEFLVLNTRNSVAPSPKEKESVNLNVWSYKDLVTVPNQQFQTAPPQRKYAIAANGGTLREICGDDESVLTAPQDVPGNYIVVEDGKSIGQEIWWRLRAQPMTYLVNLQTGGRRRLSVEPKSAIMFSFSPDGKNLAYWDTTGRGNWMNLIIPEGRIVNMTQNIETDFKLEKIRYLFNKFPVDDVVTWLPGDGRVLIYDNYDIWSLDPNGKNRPINLTNFYGARNKIAFIAIDTAQFRQSAGEILLLGFSEIDKRNGFFSIKAFERKDPAIRRFDDAFYYFEHRKNAGFYDFPHATYGKPTKAKAARAWIVLRQRADTSPNFYLTTDFKELKQVTHIAMPDSVKWLTSKLINYRALNGDHCQAVLYLPQDFDSTKRYPVIFNFYELLTHRLHQFPIPLLVHGDIMPPWFVSRDYIVCTPDIHHCKATDCGMTVGERARNCVGGCINYLKSLKYIDGKHIGMQGHSFGALETNYLVSHTDSVFAAAAEFAGVSDDVSHYLTLISAFSEIEHWNRQPGKELGHELYGADLWMRPDLYLRNSPVLAADRVSCPLLITHNSKDNNVQYRQGIEMYMALRRLHKRCWFLEYPDADHMLHSKEEAWDYTVRLTQFFDHYLKGSRPPLWMTQSSDKLTDTRDHGLRIDSTNDIP